MGQSVGSTGWAFGVVRLKHSRSRPAVREGRGRGRGCLWVVFVGGRGKGVVEAGRAERRVRVRMKRCGDER